MEMPLLHTSVDDFLNGIEPIEPHSPPVNASQPIADS